MANSYSFQSKAECSGYTLEPFGIKATQHTTLGIMVLSRRTHDYYCHMQVIFSILHLLYFTLQQGMSFISILQWDVSESFCYSY